MSVTLPRLRAHALRPDVRLEALTPGHAPATFRWVSQPDIREDLGLRTSPSLEKTIAWLITAQNNPAIHPFAITLAGHHVGNVVLDRLDFFLQTARLSVYIGVPEWRGAGVGRAAIILALREGFGPLGLHKVWLTAHEYNRRAIRTYTSIGFTLEGQLRDEFWFRGKRIAACYMGITRQEFENS